MKRLKSINIIFYFTLIILGMLTVKSSAYAEDKQINSVQVEREIVESVNEAVKINATINNVGKPLEHCPGCAAKEPNLTKNLDGDNLDLGKLYFKRDNEPYIIYLKRTSLSPAKIDLKFQNGHIECAKSYVGMLYGNIQFGCLAEITRFTEEEISLDLKNLPKLEAGQEEVIEIKLIKPIIKNSKYEILARAITNDTYKENIGKKLFGGGYNLSFKVEGP